MPSTAPAFLGGMRANLRRAERTGGAASAAAGAIGRGVRAAAVAWCAVVAVVCLVELVAPRGSPLPLLARARPPSSSAFAIVTLVACAAIAARRWVPARRRGVVLACAAPGLAAWVVDAALVIGGGGWNPAGSPFRGGGWMWLPATVPPTLVFAVIGGLAWRGRAPRSPVGAGWRALPAAALGTGVAALALVVNVVAFQAGVEDRGAAPDVIVVLGAGVHADGRPSTVLRDRVHRAVDEAARHPDAIVVMTGAHARGHAEPRVMRALAVARGVDPARIVLDEHGTNTAASVRNLVAWLGYRGRADEAVTLVSSGHHVARLRLLCRRAALRCRVVGTRPDQPLAREPYYLLREAAALVVYAASVDVAPP